VLPYTQELNDKSSKKNVSLKVSLMQKKAQRMVFNTQVVKLYREIKEVIQTRGELKKKRDFFEDLVNSINFIKFDKYIWGEFVKNIVINANKLSLSVINIENHIFDETNSTINKKMEITTTLNGDYKNFIKFIYNYENRKDLIRVNKIDIKDKNDFVITFSMYGFSK